MSASPRILGALDALLTDLGDCVAWEAEIDAEACRARTRRDHLTASVRATIEALPPPDRAGWAERLRTLAGDPAPARRPQNAPTPRTAAALDWLARREKAEFHVAELRTHLEERGFDCPGHYPSMLAANWRKRGLVRHVATGRYRVLRDHPEVAAR